MTDLEAAKALMDGVTEGPWRVCIDDDGNPLSGRPSVQAPENCDCAIVHWDGFVQEYWRSARGDKEIHANARFIAAARDLVPALIAEVEALRAQLTRALQSADASFATSEPHSTPVDGKIAPDPVANDVGAQGEAAASWLADAAVRGRAIRDDARDRGKMVKPKPGNPAGGYGGTAPPPDPMREAARVKVRFTWANKDEEFWLHMSLPDGKSAGINLGNPKGMIATACLRALAALHRAKETGHD